MPPPPDEVVRLRELALRQKSELDLLKERNAEAEREREHKRICFAIAREALIGVSFCLVFLYVTRSYGVGDNAQKILMLLGGFVGGGAVGRTLTHHKKGN